MFKNRPAVDVVVIMFAVTVSVILVLATIGVISVRLLNPEVDLRNAEGAVGSILTTVVGSLLGLVAGRASGKLEANGVKS